MRSIVLKRSAMLQTAIAPNAVSRDTQAVKTHMKACCHGGAGYGVRNWRVRFLRPKSGVKKYEEESQFVLGYN